MKRICFVLILLFCSPPLRGLAQECRVLSGSPPCVNSNINGAVCAGNALCGPDCQPPVPASHTLEVATAALNPCTEDALTTASVVRGYYDVVARQRVEGYYSRLVFRNATAYYHCNGAFFTEGDFVNCSQCQAWQISPNCLLNQASGGTCRSDAECIPGVCPTPRVTLTASIWHNCPLIGISCRIATNGGVAGVWGEAWCKYYGQTFISMDGYQYCNGQEYGEIFTGECPNI